MTATGHPEDSTVERTRQLRACFGQFATGVAVIGYHGDDGPRGVTINSFSSVSMDPPLVMVSLARQARAAEALVDRPFSISILTSAQLDLALMFAGKAMPGVEPRWVAEGSSPRLDSVAAWMQCAPWTSYDGGDHLLYLGEVEEFSARREDPLVFHRGQFKMAGVSMTYGPRILPLDGRPIAPWLDSAHRFHSATEPGALDID